MVIVLTCLVVTGLGVWLVVAQWEQANRVATIASALGTVAVVGVGIWAAVREPGTSVRAVRTGAAQAGRGGTATSGVRVSGSTLPRSAHAEQTGPAQAGEDGDAITGVHLD